MKVMIIHNIVAPYRLEFFRRLACARDLELVVLFLSETEPGRPWDPEKVKKRIAFPYRTLRGMHLPLFGSTVHFNPDLLWWLLRHRPKVIISGSFTPATAVAVLYGGLTGTPVVAWWGGTQATEHGLPGRKRYWRRWLMPRLAGFLTYSEAAKDYLVEQGVPASKVFVAGNTTFDARDFRVQVDEARDRAREWRRGHGLEDKTVVLSVGQLIPRKNHLRELQVVSELQRVLPRVGWVIVGEGPERARIEHLARVLDLRSVVFAGQVDPDQMPAYYAAADIFLHLTRQDHWSQAVNEAMAAGLPAVVSVHDHATELIDGDLQGKVVDPDDTDAVVRACLHLIQNPDEAKAMGQRALEKVASHDIHRALAVFLECITSVRAPLSK